MAEWTGYGSSFAKNGETITIDIVKLRKAVMSFRVADGYTPKSKLASTESIIQIMQMISNLQYCSNPME